MIDRGLTADLLEALLEKTDTGDDDMLPAVMRDAIHALREDAAQQPMTMDELRAAAGILDTVEDLACYLERRGYYKTEGVILYAIRGRVACMTASNREMLQLSLDSYGREWRLWRERPSGNARRYAWEAR